MSREQISEILRQAQEQVQEQIVNPSGEQFPSRSSSQTPLNNEQNRLPHEIPATEAGRTVGVQPTDESYSYNTASVHQAQEQIQKKILNASGKPLPSSLLAVGNEVPQDEPATQARHTVSVPPTDDCDQNHTASLGNNDINIPESQLQVTVVNEVDQRSPVRQVKNVDNAEDGEIETDIDHNANGLDGDSGVDGNQSNENRDSKEILDNQINDSHTDTGRSHGSNRPNSDSYRDGDATIIANSPGQSQHDEQYELETFLPGGRPYHANGPDGDSGVHGDRSEDNIDTPEDLDIRINDSPLDTGRSHGCNRFSDSYIDANATINSTTPGHSQQNASCERLIEGGLTDQDTGGVPLEADDEVGSN